MKHNPMALLTIVLSAAGLIGTTVCMFVVSGIPQGLVISLYALFAILLAIGIYFEKTWNRNKWKAYYEVVRAAKAVPVSKEQRQKDILIVGYVFGGLAAAIVLWLVKALYGLIASALYVAGLVTLAWVNKRRTVE